MNEHGQQLTAIMEAVAAIPAKADWHVAPIRSLGCLFLADDRDEATTIILEAIASKHGEVVAVTSIDVTASGRELLGCLIKPTEMDLEKAADILRGSYAMGIGAGLDDDKPQPF